MDTHIPLKNLIGSYQEEDISNKQFLSRLFPVLNEKIAITDWQNVIVLENVNGDLKIGIINDRWANNIYLMDQFRVNDYDMYADGSVSVKLKEIPIHILNKLDFFDKEGNYKQD